MCVAVPTACEDVLKPYDSQPTEYMQQPLMPQIMLEPLMMYVKMLAVQRRADLEKDQAVGLERGLQPGDGWFSPGKKQSECSMGLAKSQGGFSGSLMG